MRAWELQEAIEEASVVGSAVRLDELPKQYRTLPVIGRGASALVLKKDDNTVLIFTRDQSKMKWLTHPMGIEVGGKVVDNFKVDGVHRIKSLRNIPIYVIEMPLLQKLDKENQALVKKEAKIYEAATVYVESLFSGRPSHSKIMKAMLEFYRDRHPSSMLLGMIKFNAEYAKNKMYVDLGVNNFMQTADGKIIIVDPVVNKKLFDMMYDAKHTASEKNLDEANVIGRALRLDEIPPQYRELEMLGRGATSVAFKKDENTAVILTRDQMKKEWLGGPWGLEIEANTVDEFEVLGKHRIRGMDQKPIYVIEMPLLKKLSPQNAKIVRKELKQWDELRNRYFSKYGYKQRGNAMVDIYNHYAEEHPESLLLPMLEFAANYDESQYYDDLGIRNFMETADGHIVVLDPLVDKELVDMINDSKKPVSRW
jgi:hypothetical protein